MKPLQIVKIQIKCSISLHLIRVYTVCKGKTDLQTKEYNIVLMYNLTTQDMNNELSQVYCIKPEGRIHLYTKGYKVAGHYL